MNSMQHYVVPVTINCTARSTKWALTAFNNEVPNSM